MASSDHTYATEAALWALERGGSAADAYMTAAIAQCVLEPTMTTLGGGFGMAFWDAETGQLAQGGGFFAFPSGAPASEPYDERKSWTAWGAMVPGFVRGLETCHAAWGKLRWEDLFEPAIVFAEEGFVIDHMLWGYAKATRKMIGRFPGPGRDAWFRDGYMLGVGDVLRQPALAATLKALPDEGPDYFFQDDQVTSVRGFGYAEERVITEGIKTLNARLGWTLKNWSLYVFGENLTNEEQRLGVPIATLLEYVLQQPRTIGLTARMHF